MDRKMFRNRRSIFWPLVLIALGVIFLLNTLDIIRGDTWDLMLRLWPLLFILGGLDHLFRGEGWVWGTFSLGLGTVFMFANFGYIPWNGFNLLLRLWPLLVIAVGLDLVFKGRSPMATITGIIFSLAIIGGIIFFALTNTMAVYPISEPFSQPLGDAERASLRVDNPVGHLEISTGADPSALISGSAALARGQSLDTRFTLEGGLATYSLSSSGGVLIPWSGGFFRPLWDIRLTEDVPVNLDLNTGAGDQYLDLRGLDLERLNVSLGVGQVELILPADDAFRGQISNPVGSIVIYVPEGALVEFRTDTALSTRDAPAGFLVDGNLIYSPGANAANARVHLTVEKPIGRLSIRTLP